MVAHDNIVLGTGTTRLGLHATEPADENAVLDFFTATLSSAGLEASARIDAYLSHGLPQLFADMAAEWKGWDGEKTWSSLDRNLCLRCTHDGHGHIAVHVFLSGWAPIDGNAWSAEGVLTLEPGSLDALAHALKDLLRQ